MGGTIDFVTKSKVLEIGNCDTTFLEKYGDNDLVIDDDIIQVIFEQTSFNCVFNQYVYDTEVRMGYYKGTCGSIGFFSSINNWALDAFYIDGKFSGEFPTLTIHRGFNIKNYDINTLKLKIFFIYGTSVLETFVFNFTYAWGDIGFQGWTVVEDSFKYWYVARFKYIKNVRIEYYGRLK